MLFKDEFSFLSNFSPAEVILDGKKYPTVEHAFQAAKTLDLKDRKVIQTARTAADAKRIGRTVNLRKDWESSKLTTMTLLLIQKFYRGENKELLKETGTQMLVEHNYWHDNYWGSCTCPKCRDHGTNMLGKLLMTIRDVL